MSAPLRIAMSHGETLRLHAPRGLELTCESGQLWVTEEDEPDDVWLAPGQRVRLVGLGLAVVEAKGRARLSIA